MTSYNFEEFANMKLEWNYCCIIGLTFMIAYFLTILLIFLGGKNIVDNAVS